MYRLWETNKLSNFLFNKTNRLNIFNVGIIIILSQVFVQLILFRHSDFLITGGDTGFPLSILKETYRSFFVWDGRRGTGMVVPTISAMLIPFYALLFLFNKLGFSLVFSQKLMLGSVFCLAGLLMYYSMLMIFSLMGKRKSPTVYIGALIAAIFFMFNDYTLHLWRGPEFKYLLCYAIFPLFLLLFIKGLTNGKLKYAVIIAVGSLFFASTALNPLHIAMMLLVALIYSIYHIFLMLQYGNNKKIIFVFLFIFIMLICYVGINFYWISPMAELVPSVKETVVQDMDSKGWMEWRSEEKSVLNLLRLRKGSLSVYPDLLNPLFLPIAFIFPLIAFAALLFQRDKYTLFFAILVSIGIFLAKGVHQPFGSINSWLYFYVPFFWIFRSVDWFISIIVIGYSFLIGIVTGHFLNFVFNKKLKKYYILTIIICLLVSVYMLVFWTRNPLLSNLRLRLPQSYSNAASWLNKQSGDFKCLPTQPSSNSFYHHKSGFTGDIFLYLSDKPIVNIGYGQGSKSRRMVQMVYHTLFADKAIFCSDEILSLLNIKYLILYKDILNSYYSPSDINPVLNAKSRLGLKREFGNVEFYENPFCVTHIYSSSGSTFIAGDIYSLKSLAELKYLDGKPALFINQTQDEGVNKLLNKKMINKILIIHKLSTKKNINKISMNTSNILNLMSSEDLKYLNISYLFEYE